MKVAVIGASGRAGSRIITEALARGHQVTAIARNPEKIESRAGVVAKKGDLRPSREPGAAAEGP